MPEQQQNNGATKGRRDSVAHTLLVAFLVSLVCSVLVAATAVMLQPLQARNVELDRQRNVLAVVGLLDPEGSIEESFAAIEARVVNLETGRYSTDLSPDFDALAAARDASTGVDIDPALDIANLRRRARYATVYLAREDGALRYIILPIHGQGLWGTMYGFIALEADVSTIAGITFYQHAETPGLGGEIDNPRWQASWHGRLAFGADGEVAIEVARGKVRTRENWTGATAAAAAHRVDGLSGATLTGRAVTNMVQYWLGEDAFGRYLQRMWRRGDSG